MCQIKEWTVSLIDNNEQLTRAACLDIIYGTDQAEPSVTRQPSEGEVLRANDEVALCFQTKGSAVQGRMEPSIWKMIM